MEAYSEIIGHSITALSLMLAAACYVHRHRREIQAGRLQRTLDFIRTVYERDGPIAQANVELANWIGSGSKPIRDGSDLTDDERNSLMRLLDFFDLISQAALQHAVDREMVVTILGGKMRSVQCEASEYIASVRQALPDRREIYKPYEDFVNFHVGDRPV